jgi:hypothetical protein
MTAFRRRLIKSPDLASREEVQQMKTWPWLAKPRKAKEKFPRRVTVRERDNNLGRREI